MNADVVSVIGSYGNINDVSDSAENLMNSTKRLSEAVKSIKETAKMIESQGVNLREYDNE